MEEDEYQYDAFSGDPDKSAQELQLEKLVAFMDEYGKKLNDIADALDESFTKAWNVDTDPLCFDMSAVECLDFSDLLHSDNPNLDKVVSIFSYLQLEAHRLKATAAEKFYGPLSLFGEGLEDQEVVDGLEPLYFGRMLPFFEDLWFFIAHVSEVTQNVVRQLASLFFRSQTLYTSTFKKVQLVDAFNALGDLLAILLTVDCIISKNDYFSRCANLYKRLLRTVKANPAKFDANMESLKKFDRVLETMEGQLLDALTFQMVLDEEFDVPGVCVVTMNDELRENFLQAIQASLAFIGSRVGQPNEADVRQRYVSTCALAVFYVQVFRDAPDRKIFRQLWDIQRRFFPVIHLCHGVDWQPQEFLMSSIPSLLQVLNIKDVAREIQESRSTFMRESDSSMRGTCNKFYLELNAWLVEVEASFQPMATNIDTIETETVLLLRGYLLAYRISNFFEDVLFMHLCCDVPTTKDQVMDLCKLIQMLKAIEQTFFRKSPVYSELIPLMAERSAFEMQMILTPAENRLVGNKKLNGYQTDQLAAIKMLQRCLKGPPTMDRICSMRTCLCVASMQGTVFRDTEYSDILSLLRQWEVLGSFWERLKRVCTCTCLYSNRHLFSLFLQSIYDNFNQAERLPYILAAMQDCTPTLCAAKHLESNMELYDAYRKELLEEIDERIVTPLCREIENDLRLHIHTVVLGQRGQTLPAKVRDPARFFRLRPMRFMGHIIDLKDRVSTYLNHTFYNYTAINISDWKTYGEMRNLARERYGLDLPEVYLPCATLEQGLDVLEITRRIHVFVSMHCYDLYNQVFVQKTSTTTAKNLNTVNIRHIANSIRTHGTGIMNTTVNLVFLFLGKKFYTFSQFLFDDHIKSRLIKDVRFFRDNKAELNNMFPIEHAEKFVKDIRKLGVSADGNTYLDQFRILITEIGNAMGYVRMVRSGGQHYISRAISFIPTMGRETSFEEHASRDGLSEESVTAARNLDSVTKNLTDKFAEGSDYFKILVEVFKDEMRKEQNVHMQNFYIIVPALTLSFVEYMMICKEKLMKKKGQECNFSDDGFALGVAFILKLLNQNNKFDSLRWFQYLQQYYTVEEEKIQSRLDQRVKRKEDETQHLMLTIKRIKSYQQEFSLLEFAFSSARIFFRDTE